MIDFAQEIKRLQKLSCISLSPQEEQKFWIQLTDIIGFLGNLPQTKENLWFQERKDTIGLRTVKGVHEATDTQKLLKNVKHPIINNSIVIKSVLS
jgi:Asp-tRNA(Asn)/Glu-tRNA(Gln) amidotransferase C subunit